MEDPFLSRARIVDDPRAAAIFGESTLRRMVLALAARPRSIGELARDSGMELRRLHYHVGRFCSLGLVEVAERRARAGRPVKIYRASAEAFFIPHEVAPVHFTEGLARELRSLLADDADRSGAGVLLHPGHGAEPIARMVRRREERASTAEMWRLLRLSPAAAEALAAELSALLDRYGRSGDGRGDVYLVHTALARRRGESFSVDNVPAACAREGEAPSRRP